MYQDHSLLIDQPDYLKIADSGLTTNQRKIYKHLFKNKIFSGKGLGNAEIARAVSIAPANCIISLQGLVSKNLVYVNEDKKYWVKRYDSVNKAKALKIMDHDTKEYLDEKEKKERAYFFELGYVQEEMFDQFMFISDENLDIFINRENSIIKKHQTLLKALEKEKERRNEN